MPIHQIFPEPIYISKLERALTKEELKMIDKYKKKTHKNESNISSNDTYVLENKTLKSLKKDLDKKVVDYFDKIICTNSSITPYITQSWLNYTETNEFHHKHYHPNSHVSGVFYINADKKVDQIKFYKQAGEKIKLEHEKFNLFNSTSWWFPVETGTLIMFPSSLVHEVENKKGTNLRISLSFNVFFRGTLGNRKSATELVLK